jgi:uncharacterized membrane protein YfcA
MGDLFLVGLGGFAASLVDGALGMGFGPTSSSILLSTGLPPAAISSTVNLVKVATGLAAGVSHWRFGNTDRKLVLQLAIPGAIGAFIGVTILSNVDGNALRPYLAALLFFVGVRILIRFSRPLPVATPIREDDDFSHDHDKIPYFDRRGVKLAATAGGITNGMIGAWGPLVTPFLLHKGLPPRFTVGSVNTAEVVVAFASVGTLIAAAGKGGLDGAVILAMLAGGVVASPIAALAIRHVPARAMGVAVAGLLLLTNAKELIPELGLSSHGWLVYSAIVAVVAVAGFAPRWVPAQAANSNGRAPRALRRKAPASGAAQD